MFSQACVSHSVHRVACFPTMPCGRQTSEDRSTSSEGRPPFLRRQSPYLRGQTPYLRGQTPSSEGRSPSSEGRSPTQKADPADPLYIDRSQSIGNHLYRKPSPGRPRIRSTRRGYAYYWNAYLFNVLFRDHSYVNNEL